MDAITLLKDDHKEVEQLFKRFEKAGDRAYVTKRDIVDRIIEALSVHAVIEEQVFYPVVRATVDDTEDITLESLEEHHVVKWLLSELEGMDPEHERFDAKVTVLIENVRHHVEEEEDELFPKVREALGRNDMNEIGDAMLAAREIAPTRPHPRSPDEPPGNMVVGTVAGVADKVGDTVKGVARGTAFAARDLTARALQKPRPRRAPKGSEQTRSTASAVRSGAGSAADALIDAIRSARDAGEEATDSAKAAAGAAASGTKGAVTSAKRGTKETAEAAKSGAKRTATSARKGAGRATTTAKQAATSTARTAKSSTAKTKSKAKAAATSTRKAADSSG